MKALLIIKGKINPQIHWWNWLLPVHFSVYQKISLPALPPVGRIIRRDQRSESHLDVRDIHFDCKIGCFLHDTHISFDHPREEGKVVTGTYVVTCRLNAQLNLSGSEEEYLGGHVEVVRQVRRTVSKDLHMENQEKEALEKIRHTLDGKIESVTGYFGSVIIYEPRSWARTFS